MSGMERRQTGFTLVELLIVVIIVGVLASVAIPLYNKSTERAYLTEADTALGVIRRGMRTLILSKTSGGGDWSEFAANYTPGLTLKISDIPELYIYVTDLNGRYFDNDSYRMYELTATTYTVYAIGDSSKTAFSNVVAGLTRAIDEEGNLTTLSSP